MLCSEAVRRQLPCTVMCWGSLHAAALLYCALGQCAGSCSVVWQVAALCWRVLSELLRWPCTCELVIALWLCAVLLWLPEMMGASQEAVQDNSAQCTSRSPGTDPLPALQTRVCPQTGHEELLVMAGYTESLLEAMHVFALDLETFQWVRHMGLAPSSTHELPMARQRSACVKVSSEWLLIVGGSPSSVSPALLRAAEGTVSVGQLCTHELPLLCSHQPVPSCLLTGCSFWGRSPFLESPALGERHCLCCSRTTCCAPGTPTVCMHSAVL